MVRDEQGTGFAWMNPVCSVEIFWLLISGGYARHVDQLPGELHLPLPRLYVHELAHVSISLTPTIPR